MIPALIVPVLNRPELLRSMLDSIDYPVDRVIIVDNGDVWSPVLDNPNEHTIQPGHNLGVAASWNLGIKTTPHAPWWLISNFDIVFGPGDLESMADAMNAATEPTMAQFHGIAFSVFAINSALVEEVGLFDENLHPAYFEDNDYARRCDIAGVEQVRLPSTTQHLGSATIYGDRLYRDQNHKTFQSNKDYYVAKWGGMPGFEVHPRPFGFRLSEPGITFARIRDQAWRRTNDEVG